MLRCFALFSTVFVCINGNFHHYISNAEYEFQNVSLSCHNTTICLVSCIHGYSCSNAIIDASRSQSLHVECSEEFSCSNITVHGAVESTIINCTATSACAYSFLNASNTQNVTVSCGLPIYRHSFKVCSHSQIYALYSAILTVSCNDDESCQYADVYFPLFNEIYSNQINTIACDGYQSCEYSNIYAISTSNIHIVCDDRFACNYVSVIAPEATTMDIKCINGCREMDINATNIRNLHIESKGLNANRRVTIHAENAQELTVFCGNNEFQFDEYGSIACTAWNIYYDNDQTEAIVDCQGYGCYMLDLKSIHGLRNWNVTVNKCNKSITTIPEFHIYCGGEATAKLYYLEANATAICQWFVPCCDENETIPLIDDYQKCDHSLFETKMPTWEPTLNPTFPTQIPTISPTFDPTDSPTHPTNEPTFNPTYEPTAATDEPSSFPTLEPTNIPTINPSIPTLEPTVNPTENPTIMTVVTQWEIMSTNENEQHDDGQKGEGNGAKSIGIIFAVLVPVCILYCCSLYIRAAFEANGIGPLLCPCERSIC